MTLATPAPKQSTVSTTGRIAQIIGPVVDVQFPAEHLPEIYFALEIDLSATVSTGEDGAGADNPASASGAWPCTISRSGVPSVAVAFVKSGTTTSRISESMTPALAPSTERRSWIVPGGASNVTCEGPRAVLPASLGEDERDASATSGTRPRK